MKRTGLVALSLAFFFVWTRATVATAQDLFELEVFEFETLPGGTYDVALHTNAISSGVKSTDSLATHRPVHISVEVARGWTERLETGVFIQTAPFGPSNSTRFAGGHIRAKVRLAHVESVRIALSSEYAVNRPAFDDELQTLELRPILDRRDGRLSLILNPAVEVALKGDEQGLAPSVGVSAKVGWQLARSVAVSADYFSRSGATRHLRRESGAHHLLFSELTFAASGPWELSAGIGRCINGNEPWVVRSVIGVRLGD